MDQDIPQNLKESLDDFFKSCNESFKEEKEIFQKRKNRIIQESKNRYQELNQYKNSEQPRIINIIHGTAVASILAIYHLGHNFNCAFFISSLIFATASYIIWLYHEKWEFKAIQLIFDRQGIALDMEDEQNNFQNLSNLSHAHMKIIGVSLQEENIQLFEESKFEQSYVINMFKDILRGAQNNQKEEFLSKEKLKNYRKALPKCSSLRIIVQRLLERWYFNFIVPLVGAWIIGTCGLVYSFFAASYIFPIQVSQVAGYAIILISILVSIFLVFPILKANRRLKVKSQEILALIKKL